MAQVWWNSTTNIAFSDDPDLKLWAIVKDGIVIDAWLAVTEMEAMVDNPGSKAILVQPGEKYTLGEKITK